MTTTMLWRNSVSWNGESQSECTGQNRLWRSVLGLRSSEHRRTLWSLSPWPLLLPNPQVDHSSACAVCLGSGCPGDQILNNWPPSSCPCRLMTHTFSVNNSVSLLVVNLLSGTPALLSAIKARFLKICAAPPYWQWISLSASLYDAWWCNTKTITSLKWACPKEKCEFAVS